MLRFGLLALLTTCLLASSPAWGQEGAPDAGGDAGFSLPDGGSVGEGGADRDNEERESATGRVPERCLHSGDCGPKFSCQQGQCRYVGVRELEGGCLIGVQAALFLGGLALVTRKNRIRRR